MDMSGPEPALGEICFAGFIIDLEGKIVGERTCAVFCFYYCLFSPKRRTQGSFASKFTPKGLTFLWKIVAQHPNVPVLICSSEMFPPPKFFIFKIMQGFSFFFKNRVGGEVIFHRKAVLLNPKNPSPPHRSKNGKAKNFRVRRTTQSLPQLPRRLVAS